MRAQFMAICAALPPPELEAGVLLPELELPEELLPELLEPPEEEDPLLLELELLELPEDEPLLELPELLEPPEDEELELDCWLRRWLTWEASLEAEMLPSLLVRSGFCAAARQ